METHDTQTPDQIEAQLAQDRHAVAASLNALRDRLSLDALMQDGIGYLRQNTAGYTAAVDRAVRANPVALALTGIGIAWLVFGRAATDPTPAESALAGTRFEALSRWEDEGGPPAPIPEADAHWQAEADGLRARAATLLSQLDRAARDRLAPAADIARHRAEVLAALTADVRTALGRGLEHLTGSARDRALAAREAAYSARISLTRTGAQAVSDRPLMAGALMAAAGAALATALPGTRTENHLFGPTRDRLMDEARHILAAEQQAAGAFAQSLAGVLQADIEATLRSKSPSHHRAA